jgi:nucleoside-diphosphate-sugar epimerase
MHHAREIVLRAAAAGAPFAILRPTLIYGSDDPHNGYGPNQFRRLAARGEAITLFGEGEEQRDHVWIDDVAEIVYHVLSHCSVGILNIATGNVVTFREIAEIIAGLFTPKVPISSRPRTGPMPHKGYRSFDISATRAAFPNFAYTPLIEGLERSRRG